MLPSVDAADVGESCNEPSSPEGDAIGADELIARGKRHFVCNDTAAAVECFQEACRLLAAKYGDFGDEVGDAYMHYGKALLDLSRCESSVLGAVVPGGAEQNEGDDSDDSSDEGSEPKADAPDDGQGTSGGDVELPRVENECRSVASVELAASSERSVSNVDNANPVTIGDNIGAAATFAVDPSAAGTSDEHKASTVDAAEEGKSSVTEKNSNEDAVPSGSAPDMAAEEGTKESDDVADKEDDDNEGKNKEDDDNEGENKEDDDNEGEKIPPLQLAWEVLEMAKVIFSRHDDKDRKLKAAEAHQLLGEVSLESEVYDQAIEDFSSCLKLQSEVLGSEDRELAASHYQLGVTYSMVHSLTDAVTHFNTARNILLARVQYLQQQLRGSGDPTQSDDALKDKQRRELDDIESLLPEISAKIEDCEEERKLGSKVGTMIKESFASTSTGFGSTSSDPEPCSSSSSSAPAVINNITNLVRKKKAEPEIINVEAKRPKMEAEHENGFSSETSNSTAVASSESEVSLDEKTRGADACAAVVVNADSAINVSCT